MRPTLARCRSFCVARGAALRALLRDRRGQAGVITAILAPIIVGVAALAIDAALWQANQRSLQGAADQSAIAGVNAFVLSGATDSVGADIAARQAALAVANSFGYPSCSTADAGCPCSSGYGACAGNAVTTNATACVNAPANCLQVTITEKQTRYLSAVVFSTDPVASAKATTTVGAGGACVLALDQKGTGGAPPAPPPSVSISGTSVMTLTACNLVNNLNDPGATKDESVVNGTSVLQATQGGQILLSQTDQYFGSGRVSPEPIYGTSPAPDPYAGRTPPTVTSCTHVDYGDDGDNSNPANITKVNANTSPLNPGTYCGGLTFTGAGSTGQPIVMNPGIYIMDGGGFNASGNTVITGSNITIYITCDAIGTAASKNIKNCNGTNYGSINITGNGGNNPKLTFTPPLATTNPPSGTAGITMWIDKNAPISGASGCGGSCGTATFTGDAGLNINGAIYAPSQAVTYEGGSTATSTCSQLVALTIVMSGGHNTAFSQSGCATNSGVAGHGVAQLVE